MFWACNSVQSAHEDDLILPKQMGRLPPDQVRAIKDWARPALRVQSSPKLGYVRNLALKATRGDVIVHMDNDDFYHPRYIEVEITHIQEATVLTPPHL